MPTPEYFARQAEIRLKLAMLSSEPEVSRRLIAMAEDYRAKAEGQQGGPVIELADSIWLRENDCQLTFSEIVSPNLVEGARREATAVLKTFVEFAVAPFT